jgi:hypothetical protein
MIVFLLLINYLILLYNISLKVHWKMWKNIKFNNKTVKKFIKKYRKNKRYKKLMWKIINVIEKF